jgi:hypothetical protein
MLFYNTKTQEYPRYVGDLQLLGWNIGEPLPENWVEVENNSPAIDVATQTFTEELPELVDGRYVRKYQVRNFLPEELVELRQELTDEENPYA